MAGATRVIHALGMRLLNSRFSRGTALARSGSVVAWPMASRHQTRQTAESNDACLLQGRVVRGSVAQQRFADLALELPFLSGHRHAKLAA